MLFSVILAALVLTALCYGRLPWWLVGPLALGLGLLLWWQRRRHRQGPGAFLRLDVLAQSSRLQGWNAGYKVCLCLVLLLFCLLSQSGVLAVLIGLGVSSVSLRTSRVGLLGYISLLLTPVTFLLLSGLAILFDVSPQPLGWLDLPLFGYYLSVTPATQALAGGVMIRAGGALCCLYALSLSTPLYEITACLRRWHVPAIMVELMVLIYRYIFLLLASLHSMNTAAQARLGYAGYRNTWRTFGGVGANLLARAFKRASVSFDAMEARCYDGELRFLEAEKPLRGGQLAGAGLLSCCLLGWLIVERGLLG